MKGYNLQRVNSQNIRKEKVYKIIFNKNTFLQNVVKMFL